MFWISIRIQSDIFNSNLKKSSPLSKDCWKYVSISNNCISICISLMTGHEFEWTPGDGDGQGGLACCNSWGHKELDTTEGLNWTEWFILLQTALFLTDLHLISNSVLAPSFCSFTFLCSYMCFFSCPLSFFRNYQAFNLILTLSTWR